MQLRGENTITIEPAASGDLAAILALLRDSGLPQAGLGEHLATTLVARQGEAVIGCVALELYGEFALLRSVAVAEPYRRQGLGQRLTQAALALAGQHQAGQLYLLTETAGQFFPRFGFEPVDRALIPAVVKSSVEFTSACPASALAMQLSLESRPVQP